MIIGFSFLNNLPRALLTRHIHTRGVMVRRARGHRAARCARRSLTGNGISEMFFEPAEKGVYIVKHLSPESEPFWCDGDVLMAAANSG